MNLLHEIKNAKPEALNDILLAVMSRYRELYPDWEICTISVEKNDDKSEQLNRIIALLENMKIT